jgi:hypothetical protein
MRILHQLIIEIQVVKDAIDQDPTECTLMAVLAVEVAGTVVRGVAACVQPAFDNPSLKIHIALAGTSSSARRSNDREEQAVISFIPRQRCTGDRR